MVRREQITQLGAACFHAYVVRLTERLLGERFTPARQRVFPNGESREKVTGLVRQSIDRARACGFECEGDITPFVLMAFVLDDAFRDDGTYPWVAALLEATDLPSEQRMDAIYELIPEPQRTLCFAE